MVDVATLISQQTDAVDQTMSQAQQHLDALLQVTNIAFSDGFNIDGLLPDSYNYASVPVVNFPVYSGTARPNVATLDTTPPPESPAVAFTSLADISLPADDLLAPTAQFQFYEAVYTSTLLDPLKAKLLADLTNGGYGIETTDEIALFNRARDREIEAALMGVEGAGRFASARGFSLPPDELALHRARAQQNMQNKVSSASRDITLERSRLYVENRKFTIEQVRELEQVLIGFHNSVQERALNAARATVEMSIAICNAVVARFRARLEAAKITSDVQLQRSQIETEQARAFLEGFRNRIAAYEAGVRRQIDTARVQVEAYRADIDYNRSANEVSIARAQLQQKVLEATVQQNIQISTMTIEMAKAKLMAAVEALKFKTAGTEYAASKWWAQLTGLISTVNSLAVQTSTT